MAVRHILRKIFSNFRGLDKRSSHLTRTSEFAVEAKNVRYRKSGAISKRKGSHITSSGHKGGYGLVNYKKVNPVDGTVADEIIVVGQDNKLYKLSTGTLILTVNANTLTDGLSYNINNSTNTYFVSIYPDSNTKSFIFKMTWEDETILEYNLGSGLDTDSPTINNGPGNLDDLVEYINQTIIAAGSCSVTTSTGVPEIKWEESSYSNPISNYTSPASEGSCTYMKSTFHPSTGEVSQASNTVTTFITGGSSTMTGLNHPMTQEMCENNSACVGGTGSNPDTCSNSGGEYVKSLVEKRLPGGFRYYDYILNMYVGGNPTGGTWSSNGSNLNSWSSANYWKDNTTGFFGYSFDVQTSTYLGATYLTVFFMKDGLTGGHDSVISPTFTAPSNVPASGDFIFKFNFQTSSNFNTGDINPKIVREGSNGVTQSFTITSSSSNHYGGTWTEASLAVTNDGNWANSNFHIEFEASNQLKNSISSNTTKSIYVKDIEILFQVGSILSTTDTTNYSTNQKAACEFNGVGAGISGVWNTIDAQITAVGSNALVNDTKAAFLDTVSNAEVSFGSPLTLNVNYLTEIGVGDAAYQSGNPFTIYGTQTSSTELENATFAQLNNVLYISNGHDELMKYDGDKVYRAGLPKPATAPTITSMSSTGNVGLEDNPSGTPDKYYFYKYTYEYTDALGNIVSSEPSPVGKYQAGSAWEGAKVTYSNIQPGTGFNVDTPDKIKIKIYRTKRSETETTEPGAIYYLVNSFTTPLTTTAITGNFANSTNTGIDNGNIYNDKTSATSEYVDFLEDYDVDGVTTSFTTNEFLTYSNHIKKHDLPPKGKYITAFQDCLISAGQRENVNNLAFSLPFNVATGEIGSEYFPSDDNQELIESRFGSKITAVSPLKDILYVFHKNSIHTLSGSITEGTAISYQVDLLTSEGGIGCEAHASIQELQGNLFFLSKNGIYSINNSTAFPNEVSLPIQPDFKEIVTTFNMQKAVAFNWVKENSIIFIIPVEQLIDDNYLTTTKDSKIFVFDYSRQAWLEWDSLDFSGGIVESEGTIYFSSRSLNSTNNFISYLQKMQDNRNTYDYADGINPISFKYKTSWESIDEPTIPKKFLRLKTYAFDADDSFESPTFILNANIQKNYINQNAGSIPLDFGGSSSGGWGAGGWGVSSWGSQILDAMKTKLPSGKSKSLAVSFENNTLNENVLMSGYEMEIAGPYKKEIKE